MLKFPDINPVIISFGPLAISWYSLSYVVGILLAWFYASKLVKMYDIGIHTKHLEDFVNWVIIGVIIGGRLGYVIFYDPIKYVENPIDILKTYEGGMSFHGGIIGYSIAVILFSRKNRISLLSLGDLSAIISPIPLFLGRIANFINAELYGRVTEMPWGIVFPNSDLMPRHPSQLYEAGLEGLLLFCIMSYCALKQNKLKFPGFLAGLFLILYSAFRMFVEFFREPDIQIGFLKGGFTMGQILCIPMIFLGIYLTLRAKIPNGN